jgi:phosphinothricin acetyltransferase
VQDISPTPRSDQFRDATEEDAAAVAALWNVVIRDTAATFTTAEKSEGEIRAMIAARKAAGRSFLVAEDATGQVIGFATYDQFRGGVGYRLSMEHTIHLAPEARGQGLGRALMARLEAEARAAGVHVMVAGVTAENPAGRDFHLALGYRHVGTMPEVGHKFGRFMDLWLLQKILS